MAKRRRREDEAEDSANTTVEEAIESSEDPIVDIPAVVPEIVSAPTPAAPAPPVSGPEPAKIPLRVFVQISGLKWDQLAGFVHHVTKSKMGPLSVVEWREALHQFQSRPVR